PGGGVGPRETRGRDRGGDGQRPQGICALGGAVVVAHDSGGHSEDRRLRAPEGFPARWTLEGAPPRGSTTRVPDRDADETTHAASIIGRFITFPTASCRHGRHGCEEDGRLMEPLTAKA